ncbi:MULTISPECIES: hypothetical protein [Flavobacteriaceae]|uniref:Uncharacterized protein n=2 Tax=Flavobacteriaceae TaxID=49546 RepID=A0A4Y8AT96_9FLAO|nr:MULTISPECIES: hypothetical protein [Flavobacteriaceae]TEW75068.1 hypothetical protein E2488_05965 [Gramella jeungdoensis]GGK41919.1 hypothetical protein GCM10007963_07350 [Lutibacter litoralis]
MALKDRMIKIINENCGKEKLINVLDKYSKLVSREHSQNYSVLILTISLLENFNMEYETVNRRNSYLEYLNSLKSTNEIFKNDVLEMVIELIQYNLNYTSNIRYLQPS